MKLLGYNISISRNKRDLNGSSLKDPAILERIFGIPAGSVSATATTAQKLSAVYQATRIISGDIAGLPIGAYRKGSSGIIPLDNEVSRLFRSKVVDHITYITLFKFFETSLKHIQLRGNSYGLIHRFPKLRIEFIKSSDVYVRQDKVTKEVFYHIAGKVGPLNNGLFPATDILHFRGFGDDPLIGDSVIKYSAKSMGIGLAQQQLAAKFYEKGNIIRDFFKAPGELSDEAYNRLKEQLTEKYQGVENHRTPLLEGGVEYGTVSIKAEDFQLIASQQLTVVDIARWMNCPPDKLFDWTKVSYSSMEQSSANYALQTIAPYTSNIEQELTIKLLKPENGEYMRFNLDALIRADAIAKADSLSKLTGAGIFDRNEAREMYERNPKENLSQTLFPLSHIPEDQVNEYYKAKNMAALKGMQEPPK